MPKLPRDCSGREAVKIFQRAGWRISRHTASHIIMEKQNVEAILSVPDHKILDDIELSIDQFNHLR